jgi:hypothetical protein
MALALPDIRTMGYESNRSDSSCSEAHVVSSLLS